VPEKYDPELFRLKAELCKTLADPKRLMIITGLRDGEKSVSILAAEMKIPQAVLSRNLSILRQRGIVETRRQGQNIYYRLSNEKIIAACDMVHQILLEQMTKNRDIADKLVR
jgi:ArsR family transcriptional regulator, virulence genes transcriptional regulator